MIVKIKNVVWTAFSTYTSRISRKVLARLLLEDDYDFCKDKILDIKDTILVSNFLFITNFRKLVEEAIITIAKKHRSAFISLLLVV